MKEGREVPLVAFSNLDGKKVSLYDFKGKYVYLIFWASWCSSCTQELLLVPELKKRYGKKIDFVIISVDKNIEAVKNFLKKNPKLNPDNIGKGITFLYCDNYKKVKEEFNVLTVPTYYLIDPMGNVAKSPAEKPQNIESVFNQIYTGTKRRK
jgi:thiol-disulfide isomerase/thioredoxin